MRNDLGVKFPDLELEDHTGVTRWLSELTGGATAR